MEERSAGAVVFFSAPAGKSFLLLLNAGRWDFPKGNREPGESEEQTVLREVREESGLDIQLVPGFRRTIEYFYRRAGANVYKQVVYLLGEALSNEVTISHEHQGFGWFSYEDALKKASYENSRSVLREAHSFMKKLKAQEPFRTARADASRLA